MAGLTTQAADAEPGGHGMNVWEQLNPSFRICQHCDSEIEDRGMPRMSGPEYPLWVHSRNGSAHGTDGHLAAPRTRQEEEEAVTAADYARAIMSPPSPQVGAYIKDRLKQKDTDTP